MEKDYYKILGVEKDASLDEIKSKYRKLASTYHPDVSTDPDATKKMALINEAYDTLKDPDKRANYDMYGNSSNGESFHENYNPNASYYEYNRGFVFSVSPFRFIRRIVRFIILIIVIELIIRIVISLSGAHTNAKYNYRYYSKIDNTIVFDGLSNVNAFNRSKIKEVSIESSYLGYDVIGINSYALSSYQNLETIKIPSSIIFISDYAFYNSNNIKYIIYEGTKEDFEKIKIGVGNDSLKDAIIEYIFSEI